MFSLHENKTIRPFKGFHLAYDPGLFHTGIVQGGQQGIGILAPGQAHHHLVTITDHAVIGDGGTDIAPQALL